MSDALFDTAQKSKVTAFKPGFRMLVGNVNYRNRDEARNFRQLTYTWSVTQWNNTLASAFFTKSYLSIYSIRT